jgi:hypothetical protein
MPYVSTYDNAGNLLERSEIIVPLGLYKNQMINGIRSSCSCSIQSAGLDESTQQNAALGIYPPKRCEAIKSYIAACRNEYLRCKALILAAQTNDEADAVQFLAPPVPEGI